MHVDPRSKDLPAVQHSAVVLSLIVGYVVISVLLIEIRAWMRRPLLNEAPNVEAAYLVLRLLNNVGILYLNMALTYRVSSLNKSP
jgi:hypothetical protein